MRPAARPLSVFGTALALLCAPSLVSAQNSCQPLKDLSNRCEGLLRRQNAAPDYELLGLFAAVPPPGPDYPSQLKIRFYRPPGDTVRAINVREILHETFYEMHPKLDALKLVPDGTEQFDGWSTGDVMRLSNVRIANLGVLVHLEDPRVPDLLSPAFLYTGEPPALSSYTIDLVVHKQIAKLHCVVLDEHGRPIVTEGGSVCHLGKTSFESSEPMRIRVPAADLPGGLITVHISGDYANDESGHRLDLDVHFPHRKGVSAQQ